MWINDRGMMQYNKGISMDFGFMVEGGQHGVLEVTTLNTK